MNKRQMAIMRIVILLAFFAETIGDSFNVIYVGQMAGEIPGADRDLLTSLPITAASVMMALGVLCSSRIACNGKHFVPYLRRAIAITAAGMLLRGIAANYYLLFAGFLVVGFGYGCLFIGVRYYAFLFEDEQERMLALVHMSGGSFAGQCMGTILGGILSNQIPYRVIYLMSVAFLAVPFVLLRQVEVRQEMKTGTCKSILSVLKSGQAIRFLLCLTLPVYACTIFVSYVTPLGVAGFGFSTTVVSVIMLTNYLISAYAAPLMTRLVTHRLQANRSALLYAVATAGIIAVYTVFCSFPALILTVILSGFLDAFGFSVMTDAFIKSRKGIGSDNDALVIYILVSRLGQAVAPTAILLAGGIWILPCMVMGGLAALGLTGRRQISRQEPGVS